MEDLWAAAESTATVNGVCLCTLIYLACNFRRQIKWALGEIFVGELQDGYHESFTYKSIFALGYRQAYTWLETTKAYMLPLGQRLYNARKWLRRNRSLRADLILVKLATYHLNYVVQVAKNAEESA